MRQKSILSFLQNPKPSKPIAVDENEIQGIDTPPEKEQRHRSVFSTIMHKFSKPNAADDSASESSRLEVEDTSVLQFPSLKCDRQRAICGANIPTTQLNGQDKDSSCRMMDSQENKDFSSYCENDILRPETPGARPLIPRLKRVQEICAFEDKREEFSNPDNRKRSKLLQDSDALVTNEYVNSETTTSTKFEWLLPSKIKDCNGRNPRDPLYDKKTLYIPPEALRKMSASQKQYWDVKRHYMDVVVFFKVGKFYELYELDAEIGHKELDWKITQSGVGKCRQVGVSESGIDDAVQKLVARGYKVGRIEQLETSEQAKSRGATSVIQRKLLNVFTPATTSEGNIGPDAVHLLSIKEGGQLEDGSTAFGFAFVDCAALKFWVGSVSDDASCSALRTLLVQVSPKEIIYETLGLTKVAQKVLKEYNLTGSLSSHLSPSDAFGEALEIKTRIESNSYFSGSSNSWTHIVNGVVHCDLALCALGGVVNHLSRLKLNDVIRNGDISSYEVYRGFLRMDGQTLVNLEIFNNNADGSSSGTLFKYLDNCLTSSGKRLLRNWICHPLQDVEKINNRLTVVGDLIGNPDIMLYISQSLRKLPDLERLLARVRSIYLSSSVLLLPSIGRRLLKQRVKIFGSLIRGMRTGIEVLMLLQSDKVKISSLSKVVSLPLLTGEQGLDGFLAQFEAAMDSDFPSFQDHNVTDSDDETLSALIELFVEKAIQWSQIIHALNCIDVLRSFAISATSSCGKMCRPLVLSKSASVNSCAGMSPTLLMRGLWHPYALGENGELPVPNDIHLGDGNSLIPRALLLTGPNMGGKSTLLRATCLAVVMAQLGCYVPCETCTVSVADIIFTRLGASDRIMTGQSTFLVECSETASVLQNATQNSLVLLDELGRGTSTFDGYAIAYAVFRHLVESINCRLLFATHYHSLTKEFASHPLVKLQHMACSFDSSPSHINQRLIFLYRLSPGACPESYGMHVALMAGIPSTVVERASRAAQVMKKTVGDSFKLCELRENFSTLHEQWLKELLNIAKEDDSDDDALDSLFCLWHELKRDQAM